MRRVRFAAIALVSFLAILFGNLLSPGTWLNRSLAALICGIFSFSSATCTAAWAKMSDRAVAVQPPTEYLVGQRSSEFDGPSPTTPRNNPIPPSFPKQPGPNQPLRRPDFDRSESSDAIPIANFTDPFTGIWLFLGYDSPSAQKPSFSTLIKVNLSEQGYQVSACHRNCNTQGLQISPGQKVPKAQALAADYENLSFEIVESTDRHTVWGEILDRNIQARNYFAITKLVAVASAKSLKLNHKITTYDKETVLDIKDSRYRDETFKIAKFSITWIQKSKGANFNQVINNIIYNDSLRVPIGQQIETLDTFTNSSSNPLKPSNNSTITGFGGTSSGDFTGGGNNRGGNNQGQQGREGNSNQREGGERIINEINQSSETLQQASETLQQAKKIDWDKILSWLLPITLVSWFNGEIKTDAYAQNSQPTSFRDNDFVQPNNSSQFPLLGRQFEASSENPGQVRNQTRINTNLSQNNSRRSTISPVKGQGCTCIYSVEIHDPVSDKNLGAVGGFRASCDVPTSEMELLAQNKLTAEGWQRGVISGTAQINGVTNCNNKKQKTGSSYGDPHIVSFDGYRYSFQTVGEFTLVKSIDGDFEVQVRQSPVLGAQLSLNSAVAIKTGNSRIAIYGQSLPDNDTSTPIRVNGSPFPAQGGTLPNGTVIAQQGQGNYTIQVPTGELVSVRRTERNNLTYMDVNPAIPDVVGRYVGLLGNSNGDPKDDLQTRSGKVISPNSTYGQIAQTASSFIPGLGQISSLVGKVENIVFEQLYKEYGNSWRVSQAESLFDYRPGQNTDTFTDRSFPSTYKTLAMLSPAQIQTATTACQQAGISPEQLEGCIFDVGFTGDTGFAQTASQSLSIVNQINQIIPGGLPIPTRLPVPVNIPGLPF